MIVSMWMKRDMVTVGPEISVGEAAAVMARKHVRRLVVVHAQPDGLHLLGIVSARDVLHAFPPEINPFAAENSAAERSVTKVADIMRHDVLTTTPETPLELAAQIMLVEKIGALPVMRANHVVGIITESDIFRAFVSLFSGEGGGARITFDVTQGEDVFGLVGQLARKHGVRIKSLIATNQDAQPVFVVRVEGDNVDGFLDELWTSGHPVVNVVRFSTSADEELGRAEPRSLPGAGS